MEQAPETELTWREYARAELERLLPILVRLGYSLDAAQPHQAGERYLVRAMTTRSGRKLILLGTRTSDGLRVVIKATSDADGKRELEHERQCREVLEKIAFAYQVFLSPAEVLFAEKRGFTIFIQEFIEQELPFLSRPLREQFAIALQAFKAQESAHSTTYEHLKLVNKTFGSCDVDGYLATFRSFLQCIDALYPEDAALAATLAQAEDRLHVHRESIEQYGGFLTHIDFVPHNFRVRQGALYLLDHSSLRFGNKYEGWARFINFMTLYNPELADALTRYVALNRAPEELLSLTLMRLYRLGEILCYYAQTLYRSSGDLKTLNEARIVWWGGVLTAVLRDEPVPEEARLLYMQQRDLLRSEEEKERQRVLY